MGDYMKNLKWNKKYYKVGAVVATKEAIGVIIGFDEYLNYFYFYKLVPIILSEDLFSDTFFKGLENFVDLMLQHSLESPLNLDLIEYVQMSSPKVYLDKQYDAAEIIFWRDKSKFVNGDTHKYNNDFDLGFKIEKGGVYEILFDNKKQLVCLAPGKFLDLSALEDYKSGNYDEYLTNMKKYKWRASNIKYLYSLQFVKKHKVKSLGKKIDISWFEEKWKNLCTD